MCCYSLIALIAQWNRSCIVHPRKSPCSDQCQDGILGMTSSDAIPCLLFQVLCCEFAWFVITCEEQRVEVSKSYTMRQSAKLCSVAVVVVIVVVAALWFRQWCILSEENKYKGFSTLEYYPPKATSKHGNHSTVLNVVTCCQGEKCMKHFHNLADSLSARGYNLYRIEMKGTFTWPKLAFAYSEVVTRLPASSLVLFLDASDMLAQGCPSQLIKRFEELALAKNRSILAGVESHCSNARKCHKFKHMPIPTAEGSYLRKELQYLNGGFIMGRAEACAKAWKEIGQRFLDTQLGWSTYADEHPELVAMDWKQEVVASNTALEWESEFHISPTHGIYHTLKTNPQHQRIVNSHNSNSTSTMSGAVIMSSEISAPRSTDTARHPVFLHILCHTCQADNKVGVGGPRVYAQISKAIQMQNESLSGQARC